MDTSMIQEHMEVLGSDGEHVGTVDGIEGEMIKLTRTDPDAGGVHHLLPLSSVASVDRAVQLNLTAADAKTQWQEA